MKFTVTSMVGVTEVVDRPESARAALEQVLVLLGRKRNNVHILMRGAGVQPPRSYACWQLEKLLWGLSIQACPKGYIAASSPSGPTRVPGFAEKGKLRGGFPGRPFCLRCDCRHGVSWGIPVNRLQSLAPRLLDNSTSCRAGRRSDQRCEG